MRGSLELQPSLTGIIKATNKLTGSLSSTGKISGGLNYGTVEVIKNDYDILRNKPSINEVELNGNKTSSDIGVLDADDSITIQMINDAWDAIFN